MDGSFEAWWLLPPSWIYNYHHNIIMIRPTFVTIYNHILFTILYISFLEVLVEYWPNKPVFCLALRGNVRVAQAATRASSSRFHLLYRAERVQHHHNIIINPSFYTIVALKDTLYSIYAGFTSTVA